MNQMIMPNIQTGYYATMLQKLWWGWCRVTGAMQRRDGIVMVPRRLACVVVGAAPVWMDPIRRSTAGTENASRPPGDASQDRQNGETTVESVEFNLDCEG